MRGFATHRTVEGAECASPGAATTVPPFPRRSQPGVAVPTQDAPTGERPFRRALEAGPVEVLADHLTEDVISVRLVTDASGVATAVWEQGTQILAARTTRDGEWGEPVGLAFGRDPQAAVDGPGRVTVVYHRLHGRGVVSRRWEAGRWEQPTDLTWSHHAGAFHTQGARLAVNERGDTIVAWGQKNGRVDWAEPRRLVAAFRPHDGEWQPTVRLARRGMPDTVDLDDEGRAVVLSDSLLQRRTTRGHWRRPLAAVTSADLGVAVGNGRGDLLVVGLDGKDEDQPVRVHEHTAAGSWLLPVELGTTRWTTTTVPAVLDADRRAAVAFPVVDGPVAVATRPSGGRWSAPEVVSARGVRARLPRLAAAPDGGLALLWTQGVPAEPELWAALRPAGQGWSEPVQVTGPEWIWVTEPTLSLAPDGSALVVWVGEPTINPWTRLASRRLSLAD
ncbi:MAG: hypothetical protein KDB63_04000 [Nocardioidaceae bacterium]|nr:hypothetical protein [Nocardioidaceae bacterium]